MLSFIIRWQGSSGTELDTIRGAKKKTGLLQPKPVQSFQTPLDFAPQRQASPQEGLFLELSWS